MKGIQHRPGPFLSHVLAQFGMVVFCLTFDVIQQTDLVQYVFGQRTFAATSAMLARRVRSVFDYFRMTCNSTLRS
jgi:hypothetical protein